MNLKINGINIEVTDALKDYIRSKLERIMRHSDNVISATVTLSVDKLVQKAEVDWHMAGKDLHIDQTDKDMYAAIDLLADKLDRAVLKHKEKTHDHRAEPSGKLSAEP
ncbi:MAG: ribosome-associated translation inhibitor RaiA [Eikenella sp.]|nr:ribosome-associated translation inhibitor RaiA [Eikenella sp.]